MAASASSIRRVSLPRPMQKSGLLEAIDRLSHPPFEQPECIRHRWPDTEMGDEMHPAGHPLKCSCFEPVRPIDRAIFYWCDKKMLMHCPKHLSDFDLMLFLSAFHSRP